MENVTVLITGGAGFIGPQLVKLCLNLGCRVVVIDKLTYAGNTANIELVLSGMGAKKRARFEFFHGDICDLSVKGLIQNKNVNWIINLAAESHVDRSIGNAHDFLKTEIEGTLNILEIITDPKVKIERALFVSTDEVYGSIDRISQCEGTHWYELVENEADLRKVIKKNLFKEPDQLVPGSPYAASKASADLLVLSHFNTCRDPAGNRNAPLMITRGVNNFGPFQHTEKLLPMAICTLLKPQKMPSGDHPGYSRRIPIYDRGLAVREWLHTEDHAKAMLEVMKNGVPGDVYNVGSGLRCLNRDILIAIFNAVGANTFKNLADASFDATGIRPGHDLCYAADASKIRNKLKWSSLHSNLEDEVKELVGWYKNHQSWWEPIWDSIDFNTYWESKYRKPMTEFGEGPFEFYDTLAATRTLTAALL